MTTWEEFTKDLKTLIAIAEAILVGFSKENDKEMLTEFFKSLISKWELEKEEKHDTCKKCDGSTDFLPKSNDSLEKDNTMDYKTIETLFTYHPAPDLDVKHFEELREGAKYLGKLMLKYGKRKDDTSLAIQKLRESLHFAISSIVVPEDGAKK